MKKTCALVLTFLLLLSACGVFAWAEEEVTYYTITFIVRDADGNVTFNESQSVAEGEKPTAPDNPAGYETADGYVYEFSGWISSTEPDSYRRYYQGTIPEATENVTYLAEFVMTHEPSEQKASVTFFAFLQDLYQKIGQVMEAAADTLNTWTRHLDIGSEFVKRLFENVF